MSTKAKLGIIGAGAMGGAIAEGLVSSEIYQAEQVMLCDSMEAKLETFAAKGFATHHSLDSFKDPDLEIIIVAVKPKDISSLLEGIKAVANPDTLIISIAAGMHIDAFESVLDNPVIRVMPNTPCQVQRGASVLSPSTKVTEEQLDHALNIFESLGLALVMPEEKLDAVTALSGSGPAYIFYLIEALTEAGLSLGLTESESEKLAIATSFGSSYLAFRKFHEAISDNADNALDHITGVAEDLRERVTSPGGTTEAALRSLDESNVKALISKALKAAKDRSLELAQAPA